MNDILQENTTQIMPNISTNVTLIIGDDSFTFTPAYLESRHYKGERVEVASCLPEEKIPIFLRANYLSLTAQKIFVYFAINPAQLRNHFSHNQYSKIILVLPGIAFCGFPSFIDKQQSALFKLRIHMFAFGFLKSMKAAVKNDALIQFLWPKQDEKNELPSSVPWHGIDIDKLGPFCELHRSEADDEVFDAAAFQEWRPLIHNEPLTVFPSFLQDCIFYSWRLEPPNDGDHMKNIARLDDKDNNLLFVPPEIWNFSSEVLPHVNELLKFEMQIHDGTYMVISKPTLKFDPRFRSDGGLAKNPYAKRPNRAGNMGGNGRFNRNAQNEQQSSMMPPPPPPENYGVRGTMFNPLTDPCWFNPVSNYNQEKIRSDEAAPYHARLSYSLPGNPLFKASKRSKYFPADLHYGDLERHYELNLSFNLDCPGASNSL